MYVKKSDHIFKQIESSIERLFAERIKEASDWHRYGLSKEEFDTIVWGNIMPPDKAALIDQLGEWGFKKHASVMVSISRGDGMNNDLYNFLLGAKQLVPAHWHDWSSRVECTDPKITAVAKMRVETILKVNVELHEFTDKVKDIWEHASSVNDFCKTWPPGRDLLPHDIRVRLDEKPARREKKAPTVDINDLNGALLRARMAS